MTQDPEQSASEDLGFPPSYLQPLETALGTAYPSPKLRHILNNIDNVQKRMASVQATVNGIKRNSNSKKQAEQRMAEKKIVWEELQKEMSGYMQQLERNPVSPVTFMHPNRPISYCHKKYVRQVEDGSHVCSECGGKTTPYRRLEKEDWKREYQEVLRMQRDDDLKPNAARPTHDGPPAGFVPYA